MIFKLFLLFLPGLVTSDVMTCYYTMNDPPLSLIEDGLCTHIILIGKTTVDVLGRFIPPSEEDMQKFLSIQKYGPSTKLMVTVTGSNVHFSTLVSSMENIEEFSSASLQFLQKYKLAGLDLDWEFPVWSSGAKKSDNILFGNLLKSLRTNFGNNFLLTVAVSGPPTISKQAYIAEDFNEFVDFVQVMNYDFHIFSIFLPFVGFNAPLHKLKGEKLAIGKMNTESSMRTWDQMGLWKNKTVFGIPTYSRAYLLVNYRINKPYAMAEKTVDGFSKRAVTCHLLQNKDKYTYRWNSLAASPYLFGTDKLWITFEDERSVAAKASYAKSLKIAGIMVYDIGSDDYYGSCGNGTFPLLKTIKKAYKFE